MSCVVVFTGFCPLLRKHPGIFSVPHQLSLKKIFFEKQKRIRRVADVGPLQSNYKSTEANVMKIYDLIFSFL